MISGRAEWFICVARSSYYRRRPPRLPAQAIPGVYMLFLVDKNGVPSIGRHIRLNQEKEERDK